jgi:AraC-like DNA-binding protein
MPDHETLRAEVFSAAPGLEVSEKLFESLDDEVFCVKNRRRQYIAVNTGFVTRVRLPNKAALLGRTAREVFPALLAAGYEQQDDVVFATGQEIRDRLEMVTNHDGTTGWYLAQKVPVHNAHGEVIALAGISRDLRAPAGSDPRLAALADAIATIQRDYAQSLSIADLARTARMSLSQFERRMRAVLHVSPRQFLTKTRIDAAAVALRETKSPLGTIAIDCGFYDQAMFCRQFRHATGLTPRQYRVASARSVR